MTHHLSITALRRSARRGRELNRLLFFMLFLGQIVAQNAVAQQQSGTGAKPGGVTTPVGTWQQKERNDREARAGLPRAAGSITGRVLAEGGQPLLSAVVLASELGASVPPRRTGADADGRFRLDDLAPGAYRLTVEAPGYVVVPDAKAARRGVRYYRPGDSVNISMMKGGVITGAVKDSDDQPVVAIPVKAIRVRDGEGRPVHDSARGAGVLRWTNDQGVYRLYGLEPGVYIVVASGHGPSFGGPAYEDDVPTYHLSATRDTATEITVGSGQEISAIDIRYRGEQGHTISGTFSGESGRDPASRSVSITLTHIPSGAIEAITYVAAWERANTFALRGVPDGNYYIFARRVASETAASSHPRRVTVKGADVTGLHLALDPLGTITGRLVLEAAPQSAERKAECRNRRAAPLEEVIVNARRDQAGTDKEQLPRLFYESGDRAPDDQGNFEIRNLAAGHYRLLASLPNDDWYIRAITRPAVAPQSRQSIDAARDGLTLKPGERLQTLIITLAGGAAGLRGRVAATDDNARLLSAHLVPAERENADAVLRFAEAAVLGDGTFTFTNIAPGRYWLIARPMADKDSAVRDARPLAWDAEGRARLRREAEKSANTPIDLRSCQAITDYVLRYTR